ncbi:MAG: reverse transcriptase/maturase family protein [Candidatus Pacebacteria bacterium]|nr:reverse transcriptase/maturase family protein [Candidatus Paceibacterota bacterium]
MLKKLDNAYDNIISLENLLLAWQEFLSGKKKREDVQEFERNLMQNLISLHSDLSAKTYRHGAYHYFVVSDPKRRDIHKATVRDRIVHRAVYRILYPYFDRKFIPDSYSCRNFKGTHRALDRFRDFGRKVSRNHTCTCWVLKCDIRKFFASIDHKTLFTILGKHISDADTLWLLRGIVGSFHSKREGVGLPLGNLTSQLLVNIYMNEFDQFVKHRLKVKYYIRYADDFVFLHEDKAVLEELLPKIGDFLEEKLELSLHPDKVFIKTFSSGVDFLGWMHFPNHRVLRAATKRRMMRTIEAKKGKTETLQSYLGLLSHGNTKKLQRKIRTINLEAWLPS